MQSRLIRCDPMKRFRLSTLMLLIVIAALCVALVVQQRRTIRREAEQRDREDRRVAKLENRLIAQEVEHLLKLNDKEAELKAARRHSIVEADGAKKGDKTTNTGTTDTGRTTDKGSGADSAFRRPTPYPYAAFRLLPLIRDTISRLTATTMPSSVEITAIVFIQRRIVIRHSRMTRSSMMVWRASLLDHRFTSSQRRASTCPSQQ